MKIEKPFQLPPAPPNVWKGCLRAAFFASKKHTFQLVTFLFCLILSHRISYLLTFLVPNELPYTRIQDIFGY